MLKELEKGLYEAIGRKDIVHLASDLKEPRVRPSFKIYIYPTVSRLNGNVRLTEYDIMILFYASNINDYAMEHFEVEELFEELYMSCIELENGIFLYLDELEFIPHTDILEIRTSTTIDTLIDTEADDLLMEELSLILEKKEE